jgi:hypothetical protein
LFDESDAPLSVILAIVAGIQWPDVRGVKRLFQLKDLSWTGFYGKIALAAAAGSA